MTAALIGNVGLTLLQVYDRDAGPDGVRGGCAHVHGLTDEAYFGIGGAGAIELHDRETGFRTIPITKGTYVQFPPWTLHRSVSYAASLPSFVMLCILLGRRSLSPSLCLATP